MNKNEIKTTINAIDNAIKMFEDILAVNKSENLLSRSANQRIQANILNLRNSKISLTRMINLEENEVEDVDSFAV